MKKAHKVVVISLSAIGCILLLAVSFFGALLWMWMPHYYLPPQQRVREQFESHKADYVRFVSLLQKDPSATYIGSDGTVSDYATNDTGDHFSPEYRDLMHKIKAKFVNVREDGSVEFALWGDGGAIMSDSYMVVRYVPRDHIANAAAGWSQTVVASLNTTNLPQENGAVASGLYVVAIEPGWFIYRLEIQE